MFKKPFRIGTLSWNPPPKASGDMPGSLEGPAAEGSSGGGARSAGKSFHQLLERRIILLEGGIDNDAAAQVIAMLLYLEREDDSSPIQLHINSSGGDVSSGLAIIETIRYLRAPVHTLCLGNAQGTAAVILASGSKGYRRSTQHARIALTPLKGGAVQPSVDPETYFKELLRMQKTLIDLVVTVTGQPELDVHAAFQEGRWFDAREAEEYGLIDEVAS